MQELLNAVVHACAGKNQSTVARKWLYFFVSAWILGKRADVQMDPQLLLSADLVATHCSI